MPPGSSPEQLHGRYLTLAFQLHPDRNDGVDSGFSALTAAWAVLKDAKRRKQYDLQLALAGDQCLVCQGTGYAWGSRLCAKCEGTGRIV
jgi:DnaJ-class molecular chaperone